MAHCNWIGEHRIVMSRLGHILWVHIVDLHYVNLNDQISKGPLFSPSLYFFLIFKIIKMLSGCTCALCLQRHNKMYNK